jgi:hypothetical protein
MIRHKLKLIMLTTLFVIFVSACSSTKTAKDPVEKPVTGSSTLEAGVYLLNLTDSVDNVLVELELNVITSTSAAFSGTSKVTKVYSDSFKGYGNLSGGNFTGSYNKYDNSVAVINMNPNTQDNNIFLTLYVFGKNITGSWSYSTFTGVTNKGSVIQIKQ